MTRIKRLVLTHQDHHMLAPPKKWSIMSIFHMTSPYIWCVPFVPRSQNFWVPSWKFQLERTLKTDLRLRKWAIHYQPRPSKSKMAAPYVSGVKGVTSCLLAVVHTALFNFYLWTCCYAKCVFYQLKTNQTQVWCHSNFPDKWNATIDMMMLIMTLLYS